MQGWRRKGCQGFDVVPVTGRFYLTIELIVPDMEGLQKISRQAQASSGQESAWYLRVFTHPQVVSQIIPPCQSSRLLAYGWVSILVTESLACVTPMAERIARPQPAQLLLVRDVSCSIWGKSQKKVSSKPKEQFFFLYSWHQWIKLDGSFIPSDRIQLTLEEVNHGVALTTGLQGRGT